MSSLEDRMCSPRRPPPPRKVNWPMLGGIALSVGLWTFVGWLAWMVFR